MSCDVEARQLDGLDVYRVGRRPDPWIFTPWRYAGEGCFGGRWDDPDGEYRVLYVAASPFGALVEVLADFRPDPILLADLAEIVDESEGPNGNGPLTGQVPLSWLSGRVVASGQLTGNYADVSHSRSLATLRSELWTLLGRLGVRDLDGAAVRLTAPRELTQQISRYLYLCSQDHRAQFDGIAYRSKYGDDLLNWGFFERSEARGSVTAEASRALQASLPEVQRAMSHLGLEWHDDL